jgi:hypothetical protein
MKLPGTSTRRNSFVPSRSSTRSDIHPNIAEIYKAKVTQLSEALADPELRDQAAEAFRALVDEVVL